MGGGPVSLPRIKCRFPWQRGCKGGDRIKTGDRCSDAPGSFTPSAGRGCPGPHRRGSGPLRIPPGGESRPRGTSPPPAPGGARVPPAPAASARRPEVGQAAPEAAVARRRCDAAWWVAVGGAGSRGGGGRGDLTDKGPGSLCGEEIQHGLGEGSGWGRGGQDPALWGEGAGPWWGLQVREWAVWGEGSGSAGSHGGWGGQDPMGEEWSCRILWGDWIQPCGGAGPCWGCQTVWGEGSGVQDPMGGGRDQGQDPRGGGTY